MVAKSIGASCGVQQKKSDKLTNFRRQVPLLRKKRMNLNGRNASFGQDLYESLQRDRFHCQKLWHLDEAYAVFRSGFET